MNEIEHRLSTRLLHVGVLSLPELERSALDLTLEAARAADSEASLEAIMTGVIDTSVGVDFKKFLTVYMQMALRK
jgi:hypothetical protein